jgi:hypothetical protein
VLIYGESMNLSNVVRMHAKPIDDVSQEYLKSITYLNGYAFEVASSSLPALLLPPKNWDEFLDASIEIKTAMHIWVGKVLVRLLSVPELIVDANESIIARLDAADGYAQKLIDKGYDKDRAESLLEKLDMAKDKIDVQKDNIEGVMKALEDTQGNLPSLLAKFNDLTTGFEATIEHDEKEIKKYKKLISELNAEITKLWIEVTADAVAIVGEAILLKILNKVKNKWIRRISTIFTYTAMFVTIDDLFKSIVKIVAKNGEINVDTELMNQNTADVAQLVMVNTQYQNFKDSLDDVNTNLSVVHKSWSELSIAIKKAMNDVQKAIKNSDDKHYIQSLKDIIKTKEEWILVNEKAKKLNIRFLIKDAEIPLEDFPTELDSPDVAKEKKARIEIVYNNAKTYTVTEYYAKVM